jgi:hypothetical protein
MLFLFYRMNRFDAFEQAFSWAWLKQLFIKPKPKRFPINIGGLVVGQTHPIE